MSEVLSKFEEKQGVCTETELCVTWLWHVWFYGMVMRFWYVWFYFTFFYLVLGSQKPSTIKLETSFQKCQITSLDTLILCYLGVCMHAPTHPSILPGGSRSPAANASAVPN